MFIDVARLPYLGFFLAEIAIALAVGAFLHASARGCPPAERLSLLLCPAAVAVCLTLAAHEINQTTLNHWSGGRMFPAIGLLYSAEMYVGRDGPGAIMNTIYPPLAYLVYLPSALFSSPTWAILAGSSVSLALFLAPAVALTFWASKGRGEGPATLMGVACILLFFQATLMSKAMIHAAFQIHADAPMIGFVGLACLVLYRARGDSGLSNPACLLSATFAAMALWSKQTAITMVAALPLWILLNHGFRSGIRFAAYLVAATVALLALLAPLLEFKSFVFNIVSLPGKHPWFYEGPNLPGGLVVLTADYFCYTAAVSGSILLAAFVRRQLTPGGEPGPTGSGRWPTGNPWILFVMVGVAAVPTALLSRIKMGGFWCNYAPTPFFLGLGLIAFLGEWHAANRRRGLTSFNANLAFFTLILVVAPLARGIESFSAINAIRPPWKNAHEEAYRYCLRHPGLAYFPWHPLSTLLAEGKAYHFECGMADRELGNCGVSPEHFRRNTPPHFRYVCFPPDTTPRSRKAMRYLPEFTRRVEIEGLPGWFCFER